MNTTEKMTRNAERFRRRVDEIRRDWTRSDEARRQDLEAAYSEARSAHKALEDQYRAEVRVRVETTRKAAFAPPKIAGSEKAMEIFAYRSALDAVARIGKSTDLAALLERAEITGDTPLARACLYIGAMSSRARPSSAATSRSTRTSCPCGRSSWERRRSSTPWRLWA